MSSELNIVTQALEWGYDKAINGLGALGTAQELGDHYLREHDGDQKEAINALIRVQAMKAGAGGFLTNLGGVVTLPVAIPANLAATLYTQLRMIAAIAHIAGKDVRDPAVQIFCIACLAGEKIKEALKDIGIQIGERLAYSFIKNVITGEMFRSINKIVGMRLITKIGTTGVFNLTKMVPFLGGVVGGGVDLYYTNKIGDVAAKVFLSE